MKSRTVLGEISAAGAGFALKPALAALIARWRARNKNFAKNLRRRLTIPASALFSSSRWTRDFTNRQCGEVCSGHFWDCKLTQFCPACPPSLRRRPGFTSEQIEFFDARRWRSNRLVL